MFNLDCPILGFVAFSGTGKTTLLTKLIPELMQRGISVSIIKHAHHDFDIDKPGKDSYELRKAGAKQTLVASSRRWALMTETPDQAEAELATLVQQIDTSSIDLLLVEGFKHVDYPRIECHRPSLGHDLIYPVDNNVIAIAVDQALESEPEIPILDLNNPPQIADFIQIEILDH